MAKTIVVITGGGTAGHTNPGIATAQALVEMGVDPSSIHFVGGKRGTEKELVSAEGFSITTLSGRGVRREFSLASLKAGLSLVQGCFRGFWVMAKRRPKVVLCLGGYASFPASLAAVLLRRPLVVSEQNARSSAVNRFFSKFAKVCALPFPGTDLPKGVLTGNPARSTITYPTAAERAEAREKFSLKPGQVLVAAWSGSLGAESVNVAVQELKELWQDRKEVVFYHIVGKRNWEKYKPDAKSSAEGVQEYVVAYEKDMKSLLHAADIAICRSGASTVSELAIAGIPSILIPLPGAPRDHQTANAYELVEEGAALVLDDAGLSGTVLAESVEPLVENEVLRKDMSAKARSVARPDAAKKVAELLVNEGNLEKYVGK